MLAAATADAPPTRNTSAMCEKQPAPPAAKPLASGAVGAGATPGAAPAVNAPPPLHSRAAQLATPRYLNSRAWTIFGGTNEVQAGIIAKTVLGL